MWPLQQHTNGKKEPVTLNNRFESGKFKRVMNDKENKEMMNMTSCKTNKHGAKRIWGAQRRLFIIPCSEKQIMRLVGGSYMDAERRIRDSY